MGPRKTLRRCKDTKLETRRQALEVWLLQCIQRSNKVDHADWREPLRTFLEAPAPLLEVTAAAASRPAASPGYQGVARPVPPVPVHQGRGPAPLPPPESHLFRLSPSG